MLLAERLAEDPARIRIVNDAHGKPRLRDHGALDFNVAHCDGDALFAFTVAGKVGVDIERVRALDLRIARTCLSVAEQEQLFGLR